MSVKDHLFLVVKFSPYGDDDTNLEYSLDATTVCGFLHMHCGISEDDTQNWWREQWKHLRKTLMDFRNNWIKEMQKCFLGKLVLCIHLCLYWHVHVLTFLPSSAWMDEDENALQTINNAIKQKCEAKDEHIQLISQFAPAIKCVSFWNKNKDQKVTELLTVSDEAFLIMCIISYGLHWIAMHRNIVTEWNNSDASLEELPVSSLHVQCITRNMF